MVISRNVRTSAPRRLPSFDAGHLRSFGLSRRELEVLELVAQGATNVPENALKFEWSMNKDGSLKELEEAIEVESPTEQQVRAKFESKKGTTKITVHEGRPERIDEDDGEDEEDDERPAKVVRTGLVLLELVTQNGQLAIEIP